MGSCSALVAAGLAGSAPGTLLVVCPRISDVDAMASDLASYLDDEPLILPAWESLPSEHTLSDEVFGQRLRVLGQLEGASPPRVVVTSFPALLQPVPARSTRQSSQRRLSVGETLDLDELLRWLVDRGFERVPVIERPGEFSVHGGIIDIYTADAADPLRVELFGDEVDSLRRFDVETQRKTGESEGVGADGGGSGGAGGCRGARRRGTGVCRLGGGAFRGLSSGRELDPVAGSGGDAGRRGGAICAGWTMRVGCIPSSRRWSG